MRRLPVALAIVGALAIVATLGSLLLRDTAPLDGETEVRADDRPDLVLAEREGPDVAGDEARAALPLQFPGPALLLNSALTLADGVSARSYASARHAFDAGNHDLAAEGFHDVAAGGGLLAPMALLRQAQALVAADRREEAVQPFAAAIQGQRLPGSVHVVALTEAASNLHNLDRSEEALTLLGEIGELASVTATQRADAHWRSARIRRELGDPRWSADAIAVLRAAPGSGAAREALDAIDEAGVDAPLMTLAQANYRVRRNGAARALYEEVVADASFSAADRATAWFYLGALEERRDEPQAALDAYARSLELAPNGALAADALYWRGRVLEEIDRPDAAAMEYDLLVRRFPQSNFARDARLRAAIGVGLAGAHEQALGRLEAIAESSSGAPAAVAARWHAVFRDTFGASSSVTLNPRDYHPAALWSLLDASTQEPLPATGDFEAFAAATPPGPDEIAEIQAWLSQRHGSPNRNIANVGSVGVAELGLALTAVGEEAVGRALLQQLVWSTDRTPHELLELSVVAHRAGLHDVSLRAAMRLVSPLSAAERMQAPRALLKLAYPIPFAEEFDAAIQRSPVSPLLLLALVRQESAFHPGAVSHADAMGLAQVIPTTGQDIARALGEPWAVERLVDPATSLRFGAYYLHTQLRNFDGDVLAALGAYNAGGGSVARWRRTQVFPGPDGFIHTVDFAETRLYFEHVLENYAWYRFVYGASETPSIR